MDAQPAEKPSEARGGFLAESAMVLLVLLLAALLHHLLFMGPKVGGIWKATLYGADQMEYAQMGRHLYRGDGFATSYIYPPSLVKVPHLPHPNLIRPPLYPLAISAEYRLAGGPSESGSALVSFLFHLAAVAAVYAVCRRFAGRVLSALAALVTAVSPALMAAGGAGLSESLAAFLLTAAIGLAAGRRHPFLAGIFLGLAYLSRYQFLPLIVPFAVYLALGSERKPVRAAAFLAGFVIMALPWWIRNYLLVGNPFFSLVSLEIAHHTKSFLGSPFYGRTDAFSPVGFALTHPAEMAGKFIYFTGWGLLELGMQLGPFGIALLIAALVMKATRGFAVLILAILFFNLAIFGLGHFEPRYLVPLLPGLFAAGFAFYGTVWRMKPRELIPSIILIVMIPLHLLWLFFVAAPPVYRDVNYNTWWMDTESAAYVQKEVPAGEMVLTSVPWSVAWQCDRPAIYPVERPEDLEAILNLPDVRIAGVYRGGTLGFVHEAEILESTAFKRHFYLKERLPSGGIFWAWKKEGEDWLKVDLPFLAWDGRTERPVTLDLMLRDAQRWGDEVYPMRDAAERIRDFEITPGGEGLAVLLEDGSILAAGDATPMPGIAGSTDAVQLALLDAKSGAVLHASGTVRLFGEAKPLGNMENALESACDFDFVGDGAGYYILNRFGRVDHFGKAAEGKTPNFGWQAVVALEPAPKNQGWYVLDVYGAIHKSRPGLPDLLGPYHPFEKIGKDFLIAPNGTAYVLTVDGAINAAQSKP